MGRSIPLIAYGFVRGVLPIMSISSAETSALSYVQSILFFLTIIPVLSFEDTLSAGMILERKIREHTKRLEKLKGNQKTNR